MNLQEYVASKSQAEVARELNVSPGLVWQWLNGETRITAERAKQIHEITSGRVSKHELRPDIWGESVGAAPPPEPAKAA